MNVILGKYNQLEVVKEVDFGVYLNGGDDGEVLLPTRYVPEGTKPGDMLNVFIYLDNEERLIATTLEPKVQVGEFACLEVAWVNEYGAFLDWGLSGKHLFLPNRNQQGAVIAGQKSVVYMYIDERTGRCVATNKIKPFIYNEHPLTVEVGDEVDVLVAFETPIGYRVVLDNRHWGMIYKNQLFRPIAVGDRCRGWV